MLSRRETLKIIGSVIGLGFTKLGLPGINAEAYAKELYTTEEIEKGRFIGRYYSTLAANSMIVLPEPFNAELQSRKQTSVSVANAASDKCLNIFPSDEWMKLKNQIEDLPRIETAIKYLLRRVVSSAREIGVDKNGRFFISREHCEHAGIDRNEEIAIVGLFNKIEIWSKREWYAVTNPKRIYQTVYEKKLAKYLTYE